MCVHHHDFNDLLAWMGERPKPGRAEVAEQARVLARTMNGADLECLRLILEVSDYAAARDNAIAQDTAPWEPVAWIARILRASWPSRTSSA